MKKYSYVYYFFSRQYDNRIFELKNKISYRRCVIVTEIVTNPKSSGVNHRSFDGHSNLAGNFIIAFEPRSSFDNHHTL